MEKKDEKTYNHCHIMIHLTTENKYSSPFLVFELCYKIILHLAVVRHVPTTYTLLCPYE